MPAGPPGHNISGLTGVGVAYELLPFRQVRGSFSGRTIAKASLKMRRQKGNAPLGLRASFVMSPFEDGFPGPATLRRLGRRESI